MSIWPVAKWLLSASFLSLIIGLIALYYTVRGSKTDLVVDVTSESNVMDVRTPLKDLAILFQGQDIQKENSNLRILAVRIVNEGESNILENYFDSRIPWGLQIIGGRLIEARITGSNSEYLAENLHPTMNEANTVVFNKVIFDKGKYVTLELLVLHSRNVEPRVKPVGKIAGMDDIPVRSSFRGGEQEGLVSRVFKGPISVQIARTIAYSLIGLGTVIAVGFSIAGLVSIPSRLKKRSRKKLVRSLAKETSTEKEKKRQVLLDIFVEGGIGSLKRMLKNVENEDALAKTLAGDKVLLEVRTDSPADVAGQVIHEGNQRTYVVREDPITPLLRAGVLRQRDKSFDVDPEMRDLLSSLIIQLSKTERPS
jgi:hypothetical protein